MYGLIVGLGGGGEPGLGGACAGIGCRPRRGSPRNGDGASPSSVPIRPGRGSGMGLISWKRLLVVHVSPMGADSMILPTMVARLFTQAAKSLICM